MKSSHTLREEIVESLGSTVEVPVPAVPSEVDKLQSTGVTSVFAEPSVIEVVCSVPPVVWKKSSVQ